MKFFNRLSNRLIITHLLVALITICLMIILALVGTAPVQHRYAQNRVTDLLLTSQLLSHAPAPRRGLGPPPPLPDARAPQQSPRDGATNARDNQLGTGPDRPRRDPGGPPRDRESAPPFQDNVPRGGTPGLRVVPGDELEFLLQEQADIHDVRILLVRPNTDEVYFDSDRLDSDRNRERQSHHWQPTRRRERQVTADELGLPDHAQRLLPVVFKGTNHFEGRNWLYASARLTPDRLETSSLMVVMAPLFTSRRAIGETLQAFHIPLLLVILIFLVLMTALLSIWLTRLITKGLLPLFEATREIGKGHLSYRISDDPQMPREFTALAKAFNEMAEQTQRQQQALRDFIANVGHDLKTPLTSISGFCNALMDGTAVGPMRERAVEIIYEEAQRLEKRIENLLDLARLENPQRKLALQILDINEQLQMLVEQFESRSQAENVELIWQPSNESCMIEADADDLHRIFSNLLDNAFTHTQAGGLITLTAQHIRNEDGRSVEVTIEDNGSGIPAEDLPNIFERFYQVDKARTKSNRGSGLGLSIVKELVEVHNGSVGVESTVGTGSRFWVRFTPQP